MRPGFSAYQPPGSAAPQSSAATAALPAPATAAPAAETAAAAAATEAAAASGRQRGRRQRSEDRRQQEATPAASPASPQAGVCATLSHTTRCYSRFFNIRPRPLTTACSPPNLNLVHDNWSHVPPGRKSPLLRKLTCSIWSAAVAPQGGGYAVAGVRGVERRGFAVEASGQPIGVAAAPAGPRPATGTLHPCLRTQC